MRIIKLLLIPVSLLYGLVIFLRNLLYDLGILPSTNFRIPVISVGNLTVGGTGKTPHVEHLVNLLKKDFDIAILSRGYGRKTDNFILADEESTSNDIGDEPLQFKKKFPDIIVAVDANRKRGINNLLEKYPNLAAIILDDAFQHRRITPGISILLRDYKNMFTQNFILPTGTLREWSSGSKRADIIVITKTPVNFSPIERKSIKARIQPLAHQQLYFSFIRYKELVPFTQTARLEKVSKIEKKHNVILFTGIAKSQQLEDHLREQCDSLEHFRYADHHRYSIGDIQHIQKVYQNLPKENKIIITTEKDTMRLQSQELMEILDDVPVYYLPIKVVFHEGDNEEFNAKIIDYVRKNQIHNRLYQS